MAFVSIKNLVAPASNTVHLISIVFVVLLFGLWRWSGGEINIERSSNNNPKSSERSRASQSFQNNRQKIERLPESGEIQIPEEAADDLFGTILKDKSNNDNYKARKDTNKRKDESLEDIERSLGLR